MTTAATPADQKKEEPLYQQGRFPSIIDTDDLVFELGKQAVSSLNHEKLIERLLKQIETLKQELARANQAKVNAEHNVAAITQKVKELENSNRLFEENNRKLDMELVKLRSEIERLRIVENKAGDAKPKK